MNDPSNVPTPEPSGDHLLDSLLDEFLGHKRPPDLRRSIRNRLSEVETPQSQRHWENAVAAASTPSIESMLQPLSESTPLGSTRDLNPASSETIVRSQVSGSRLASASHTWSLGSWSMLVATAIACCMGLVWCWGRFEKTMSISRSTEPSLPPAASVEPAQPTPSGLSPTLAKTNPNEHIERDRQATDRRPTNSAPSRELSREPNRETLSESPIFAPKDTVAERPHLPSVRTFDRLDFPAMVAVINGQFGELWTKRNIVASPAVTDEVWLERVTQRVLGRQPTSAEQTLLRTGFGPSQRMMLLEEWTQSEEFAARWGRWLSQEWLPPTTNLSARRQFESWIIRSLEQRVPINELQQDLLSPSRIEESNDFRPSMIWLVQHASQGNQNFAERFCRVMLEQPLVCSRCHDSLAGPRSAYYGFASLLSSLEMHQVANRSTTLQLGPGKRLFYEMPDGTLKAADPCLPDATLTDHAFPFEALSQWFLHAPERRHALVNRIWTELLGSPLVPVYGLSEEEGLRDRIDLRDFLADQWSAQGEDIRHLVAWLACSDVFLRSTIELRQEELWMAPSDQIESTRMAELLFANFSSTRPESFDRAPLFQEALQQSRLASTRITLGQVPDRNPSTLANGSRDAISFPSARLQQMSLRLEHGLEQQIERWSKANLDWEMKVQHARWLCGNQAHDASDDVLRERARILLDCNGGNESTALRQLLAIELGNF